jgi:hypothetical protein
MGKHQITIELDDRLGSYQDTQLAMLWHLAQANPAPHGDRAAGELVERIGREIIGRWLKPPRPSCGVTRAATTPGSSCASWPPSPRAPARQAAPNGMTGSGCPAPLATGGRRAGGDR